MKTNIYIFIFLALAGVMVGCGTGNSSGSTSSASAGETTLKSSILEEKPSNWYIRLVVEDTSRAMVSNSTKLGELTIENAVETQTLEAWSPVNDAHLGIFFIDPEGVAPGEYRSSFHMYKEEVEGSWDFIVRTDDANAELTLTWRGLYVLTPYEDDQGRTRYKEYRSLSNPLNKHMKLIDLYNDEEIPAVVNGKAVTYSFSMEGQTQRAFRWVVQNDIVELSVESHQLSAINTKLMKEVDLARKKEQAIMKRAETFDLSQPPFEK